ncbi:MAG TPA: general stress protein CsbD [Candidatus Paceibacterota bacterium]|nr:general stress protein CsbD [Candidatus Paceibacterota bacterium]
MNKLEIKGDSNIIKGRLKQNRDRLTDDKLQYVGVKSEELPGRNQQHTNGTR